MTFFNSKGRRAAGASWLIPPGPCLPPSKLPPAAALTKPRQWLGMLVQLLADFVCTRSFLLVRAGVCGLCGSLARLWGCRSLGTGCPHLPRLVGPEQHSGWARAGQQTRPVAVNHSCHFRRKKKKKKRPKEKRCASLKHGFVLTGAKASPVPPSLLCPSLPALSISQREKSILLKPFTASEINSPPLSPYR